MIIKTSSKKLIDSVLLIVDVEKQYLKKDKVEFIKGDENKVLAVQSLNNKIQNMPTVIKSITKENEAIYIVHEKELHQALSNITYIDLGDWEKSNLWLTKLKENNKRVAICGMWKELCCLEVYERLVNEGVDAYILEDDALTFSLCLYGSPLPFELKTRMFGYTLERI